MILVSNVSAGFNRNFAESLGELREFRVGGESLSYPRTLCHAVQNVWGRLKEEARGLPEEPAPEPGLRLGGWEYVVIRHLRECRGRHRTISLVSPHSGGLAS